MTRQVIPSMLLSVLIVCFFSVLLHERETPPPTAPGSTPTSASPPATTPPERKADAESVLAAKNEAKQPESDKPTSAAATAPASPAPDPTPATTAKEPATKAPAAPVEPPKAPATSTDPQSTFTKRNEEQASRNVAIPIQRSSEFDDNSSPGRRPGSDRTSAPSTGSGLRAGAR